MKRIRARKCLHCHQLFKPDPRSRYHQRYCSQPLCRQASKAASHRRWLAKPENRDYYCGPEQVERVRRWRQSHPKSYSTEPLSKRKRLQDDCSSQPIEKHEENQVLESILLQDLLISQPYVLMGLIGMLSGLSLQEDIDTLLRRLEQLGRDWVAEKTPHSTVESKPKKDQ